VPVQVPRSVVSVCPSRTTPETLGAVVLAGATAATVAVWMLADAVGPAPLVAVTTARSVDPTSAPVGVYVVAVAPARSAQFAPAASQRRHCCA
jgi:hypothetical protein